MKSQSYVTELLYSALEVILEDGTCERLSGDVTFNF